MTQTPIAEGQVWTFAEAPADAARVVIRRIEPWREGGEIVHISFHGLPPRPRFTGDVPHMPFDRASVEASLLQLTDETPPEAPTFDAAYGGWKSVHNDIFRVPLIHAIRMMFATMPRSRT